MANSTAPSVAEAKARKWNMLASFGLRLRQYYQFLTSDFQLESLFRKKKIRALPSTQDLKLLKKSLSWKDQTGSSVDHDVAKILIMYVCVCVCVDIYTYIYPHTYIYDHMYIYIQGVPGGKDLTPGGCSLGQTIPI